MATIGNSVATLTDHLKRLDPNGAVANVVELLSKQNPLVEDMLWKEGNLPTGHRVTSRTGLPSVGWRRLNQGVAPSKSTTEQYDETCGILEGYSTIDTRLAALNGNTAAFRASEELAFVEAMFQELETAMFYASSNVDPEKPQGLAPRLNSTTGRAGSQVLPVDSGASGNDQTSIYGIVWGDKSAYGIFPKGSTAGLERKALPDEMIDDGTGKQYLAHRAHWGLNAGLAVEDYRQVVRLANIDTGSLSGTADTLIPAMIEAYYQLHKPGTGRLVWYANRRVQTYLHLQARANVKNSTLSIEMVEGKPVTTFMGAPIRISDAILNTEAAVS